MSVHGSLAFYLVSVYINISHGIISVMNIFSYIIDCVDRNKRSIGLGLQRMRNKINKSMTQWFKTYLYICTYIFTVILDTNPNILVSLGFEFELN